MTQTVYVSMDFETTGLDPDRHGPLQVGFANDEINWVSHMNPGDVEWDHVALTVNNIDFMRVPTYMPVWQVDLSLAKMFDNTQRKYAEEGERVIFEAVGLNVGNFDMQFLRKFLPNTYKFFGHRPVDLNAVFLAHWGLGNWKGRRDTLTHEVLERMGIPPESLHDALTDAIVAWEIFKQIVNLDPEPMEDMPF